MRIGATFSFYVSQTWDTEEDGRVNHPYICVFIRDSAEITLIKRNMYPQENKYRTPSSFTGLYCLTLGYLDCSGCHKLVFSTRIHEVRPSERQNPLFNMCSPKSGWNLPLASEESLEHPFASCPAQFEKDFSSIEANQRWRQKNKQLFSVAKDMNP